MKPQRIRFRKFFLTLFNITFIFVGLMVMAICVMNLRDIKIRPQSALYRGVLAFLFSLALGVIFNAVQGCVGALRENVKILYAHACFFVLLVFLEGVLAVGGAILTAWAGSSNELRVHFYRNTTEDGGGNYTDVWDAIQSENQCCGVDGPQDYAVLQRDIPLSCCARAHSLREGGARRQLHATCLTHQSYYMRGCENVVRRKKSFKGNIFIAATLLFMFLEVSCIIMALKLIRSVKAERQKLQETLQAHFEV